MAGRRRNGTPESGVMRAVTEFFTFYRDKLHPQGILHFRNNVGAMSGNHKGKRWYVRFGMPGQADYEAHITRAGGGKDILWVECKSAVGRQTSDQAIFQRLVEAYGEFYILARSSEDVKKWLKEHCP